MKGPPPILQLPPHLRVLPGSAPSVLPEGNDAIAPLQGAMDELSLSDDEEHTVPTQAQALPLMVLLDKLVRMVHRRRRLHGVMGSQSGDFVAPSSVQDSGGVDP